MSNAPHVRRGRRRAGPGACGECASGNTALCVEPLAQCEVTSGSCVECLVDADCGALGICHLDTFRCDRIFADGFETGDPGAWSAAVP